MSLLKVRDGGAAVRARCARTAAAMTGRQWPVTSDREGQPQRVEPAIFDSCGLATGLMMTFT
ncbi:hypothetical protein ACFPN7_29760 [Amycolatopsis halotolerans]|uniref:hypothetical protein n=1 Tax=Amycolatopsis halotolerans TaxID=330083 RepID=UPI00361347FA